MGVRQEIIYFSPKAALNDEEGDCLKYVNFVYKISVSEIRVCGLDFCRKIKQKFADGNKLSHEINCN
jgi:hypothetical protein